MSAYSEPASEAVDVTPSDVTTFDATRGLYVGGTGDLTVTMANGADCQFDDIPAGSILPLRVTAVKSTGTTATDIVALR